MPVVACPKCPTQLKIPDGAKGNVRCPKCGTIFPAAPAPAAAFEVVDESPPKPASPSKAAAALPAPKTGTASKPSAALPKPAPVQASAADDADFDVVEDKPKKKRRDDDDDDDDDDDRPRSRKRKRRDDDDDDDDDDRPRRKKKSKRRRAADDDEDDDWRPKANPRGAFAKGKTGAQLLAISFWLNMGAYGLLTLYALIAWIMLIAATSSSPSSRSGSSSGGDGSFMDVLVVLPGLLGLGAWIVGTIGCAFAIAGPPKARGMAITATVFAAIHLLLTGVTFSNMQDGLGLGRGVPGVGKVGWIFVASTLPALDAFLPILFYQSKGISGDYVIALLAAVAEVGRLIFALLTLKAMAVAARDYEAGEKAQFGVMVTSFVVGGAALGTLLMVILLAEGGVGMKTAFHLAAVTVLAVFGVYTFMMLAPAQAALQTKDACDRRS